MPNGAYGRFVPRLALAVAQYRARFGEWPTHAHGSFLATLLYEPGEGSDYDDFAEYRPEIAAAIRARLICDPNDATIGLELSGPAGRSSGYGDVARDTPETVEAYRWLYGEDPWWARDVDMDS